MSLGDRQCRRLAPSRESTPLGACRATVAEGRYIGPSCLGDGDLKVRRPFTECVSFLCRIGANEFRRKALLLLPPFHFQAAKLKDGQSPAKVVDGYWGQNSLTFAL